MHHARLRQHGGFSVIEVIVSAILVMVLLSMLVPALSSARVIAHQDQCANNLRQIGEALSSYLEEHDGEFPFVPGAPGWHYGGVRYSATTGEPFLDPARPLNRWLMQFAGSDEAVRMYCCPADFGIISEYVDPAADRRTACRVFGTSYHANPNLFDVRERGLSDEPRAMRRREITTAPSRLLVLGDAVWHEVYHSTGRRAAWHREENMGNFLFLDGAVRFRAMRPKEQTGPVVVDPIMPGTYLPGEFPMLEDAAE